MADIVGLVIPFFGLIFIGFVPGLLVRQPIEASSSSRSSTRSVERASASILVTTMLSVFSVTVLLYAVKGGLLPPDLFP
jgi:hypothetical protein